LKRVAEIKLSHFLVNTLPVRLHLRSDLHLARKIWHMGMGLVIAFIYMSGLSRSASVIVLGSFLGLDLLVETARLRIPSFNESVMRFWGPIMRSCEVNRFSGVPYYLSASILAIGIFPKAIAILSILYLACGDPIASLFGILHGDRSVRFSNGKSLVGTLAGVITCMLATFVYLKTLSLSDGVIIPVMLLGGIAGGAAELLPLEIDDNFSIPVVSGFILWLGFILLGI
jgi:diacylglycerol kinase (CTP)